MGSRSNPPDEPRDHDADERETAWAKGLRARYDQVARESLPDRLRDLLEKLEDAESRKRVKR
jgi:predicted metal-dependent hydrolase